MPAMIACWALTQALSKHRCLAKKGARVCMRGRRDVVPLPVGDHEETRPPRRGDGVAKSATAEIASSWNRVIARLRASLRLEDKATARSRMIIGISSRRGSRPTQTG